MPHGDRIASVKFSLAERLRRGLRGGGTAARCVVVTRADGTRVGVEVLDILRGLLRLGGRVHQQGRVMAQDRHPALAVP